MLFSINSKKQDTVDYQLENENDEKTVTGAGWLSPEISGTEESGTHYGKYQDY